MSETINLELLEAARYDSTLGYVIKKGLPLNRRTWINQIGATTA
jgi:hypothetical protein